MAFWGEEVKPKKSFTLKFSDFEAPRFHLSQATLGSRKSDERVIVKCSVADKPAVFLCSLLPGTVETCSLDLYFDDDVTFSVKGSSSVHLVGYFEGTFDGNESGEDVEDDGYSEEYEDESEGNSLDDFIISEDEDQDEWSSEEEDPVRAPKSGVTVEEIPDEPSLNGPEKKAEIQETILVPVKSSAKKPKQQGAISILVEDCKGINGKGVGVTDDAKHASSSEDEDGFHVNRKRKLKESDNVQPSKKMSNGMQPTISEPVIAPADHETDTDSKVSIKKKKKKKKKGKSSAEDIPSSPSAQGNESSKVDSGKGGEVEKQDSKIAAASSKQESSKKGTVRKHPNGLEIENMSMGEPDGKQATPGKKVGMIYTGRLRSNGKIFDSNVGKKPFFFRLGVGEVIKGWDIGVNGMRVGDKRRLTIPPNMGYGSKGVPGIPPNSWLVFDVELMEVK